MARPSRIFDEISFPAGALIFAQGDIASALYLVVQGVVECWPGPAQGKQLRVSFREGMIVGEGGLQHPTPYAVSAAAGPQGCRVLHVPHTAIQPKLDRSDPMIVTVIRMLMDYTRNTNKRVVELLELAARLEQEQAKLPGEITLLQEELGSCRQKQAKLDGENAQLRKIVDEHIRGRKAGAGR